MKSSEKNKIGPIGIFDSGYGGLTILKEIVKELPQYDYLYLGDNARSPYGTRSSETVYKYTLQCVKVLFDRGCHLVILACNTASAQALRTIQENDLPKIDPKRRVLGVIRPTAEVVGIKTESKHIGVFGTNGTIDSNTYKTEINRFFKKIKVYQQACPMWVPLVENDEFDGKGADYFIKKDIKDLLKQSKKIDTIILGCTHYPLLEKKIDKYLPKGIKVIPQGPIVADRLADYLMRHKEIAEKCSKYKTIEFLTTESTEHFDRNAKIFFGKKIKSKHLAL